MFYDHLKTERIISGKEQQADDKGKFEGECNRTVCTNRPAEFYNHSTKHYYCGTCARKINDANRSDAMRLFGHDLCTKGKQKHD